MLHHRQVAAQLKDEVVAVAAPLAVAVAYHAEEAYRRFKFSVTTAVRKKRGLVILIDTQV